MVRLPRGATDLVSFCAVGHRLSAISIEVAITTLDAQRTHGPFAAVCERVPKEENLRMFRR